MWGTDSDIHFFFGTDAVQSFDILCRGILDWVFGV